MNTWRPDEPRWVAALCRLYAVALRLYPRAHREQWGAEMWIAFRDRCREAVTMGHGPLRVMFTELLPDLVVSASREQADFLWGCPR